ncbi:MAG: sulfide/dihydroorotate dehydrogenase-like FAD/NAD-binding protein [Eubacteriales bacterium]
MFQIVSREELNPSVVKMTVSAPAVAKKAKAGQFVILRVDDEGERIPLTVADYDRTAGTVTVIFQTVGASTMLLGSKKSGEYISDFVGPLGNPTETEGFSRVCVVGGGVGSAIAYPAAKAFSESGAVVDTVVGFRSKDLVILENEFRAVSDTFILMTDDGTAGEKGLVTDSLRRLLETNRYDEVLCIGPIIMMKFVCRLTAEFGVKTVVSMNPIMIDGTGMCGGCRLTVGGRTVFACVDGPEFDGHQVDFDEAMSRNRMYSDFEKRRREETCALLNKEVK